MLKPLRDILGGLLFSAKASFVQQRRKRANVNDWVHVDLGNVRLLLVRVGGENDGLLAELSGLSGLTLHDV